MKSSMTPQITLAIVLLGAIVAVRLRAAARRPEPRWAPGADAREVVVSLMAGVHPEEARAPCAHAETRSSAQHVFSHAGKRGARREDQAPMTRVLDH
jgi:hypothetical protein